MRIDHERTRRSYPRIAKNLAIIVLLACAACGRIGYDQVVVDAAIEGGRGDAACSGPGCGATDGSVQDGSVLDGSLPPGAVSAVFAGYSVTCAILSGGELFCFGDGESGQFGQTPPTNALSPTALMAAGVREVAIGELSLCIRRDAAPYVQCSGDGSSGQLGDGTIAPRNSFAPASVGAVTSLAAGWRHVIARTSATQLHAWGNGTYGQLGQGGMTSTPSPIAIATALEQITAGGFHSCGRRATTGIECWGRNDDGQSGAAGPGNVLTPTLVTATSARRYIDVDAGQFHTCAVRDDGVVECWGSNAFGQFGDMSASGPTPVVVTGLPAARDIDCGYYHCCARIEAGGELWCWGAGDSGQLGRGSTTPRASAGRVLGLGAVTGFATGAFHTCAIDTSLRLWCWGANESGQLGIGNMVESSTPMQVTFD